MNKQLPSATKIEQQIISACLLFPENVDQAVSLLETADFYDGWHRKVFAEIKSLHEQGREVDEAVLEDRLDEEVYFDTTQASTSIEDDARDIKKYSDLRNIIKICRQVENGAYNKDDPNDLRSKLNVIFEHSSGNDITSLAEALTDAVERNLEVVNGERTLGIKPGLDVDDTIGGYEDGKVYVIAARPAMGKAQTLNSKVLTKNNGFKRMGDIEVGDELASYDGEPSIVSGVFPQGKKETYTITFSDGRVTRATGDHLWKVGNRKWKEDKVLTTKELIEYLKKPSYENRIWIDLVSGDFGHNDNLPIDPYVLGVLLGDGGMSSDSLEVSNSNIDIIREFRRRSEAEIKLACRSSTKADWRINSPEMRDRLRSLGLWGEKSLDKFIPKQYLSANKHVRIELLQGLMDTDGWAEKSGSLLYSSSSKQLADDFVSLIRSLGGVSKQSIHHPIYSNKEGEKVNGNDSYRCTVRFNDNSFVFRHYRLRDRASTRHRNSVRLNVASIVKDGYERCQCIKVTHPDSCYITDQYINTHNTAYALHIMKGIASQGVPVGMLSLEMGDLSLANRILINAMGIDGKKLRQEGGLSEQEKEVMFQAASQIGDLPIYFDDSPVINEGSLRAKANIMKRRYDIGALVIDYLQLMSGSGNNRREIVDGISRTTKLVAKDLNIPVIPLSQLSRAVEQRDPKRPQLSDLRESGAIEQDADCVQFLYRPSEYGKEYYPDSDIFDGPTENICEVIVAKNRSGETGIKQQLFIPSKMQFKNLESKYNEVF